MSKGNEGLGNTIYNGLAMAHMQKGERAAAIDYFEKVLEGPSAVLKDAALFQLGRLYGVEGDAQKSLSAYKRLNTDFPGLHLCQHRPGKECGVAAVFNPAFDSVIGLRHRRYVDSVFFQLLIQSALCRYPEEMRHGSEHSRFGGVPAGSSVSPHGPAFRRVWLSWRGRQ